MKKEFSWMLTGCTGVLFFAAGCAPELAQVPVGQEEKNWDKVLKQNYSSFRPPHTPAPAAYQPEKTVRKPLEKQELPEAVEDPVSAVDRAASGEKVAAPAPVAEVKEASKAEAPAEAKKAEAPAAKTAAAAELNKPYIVQPGDSLGKIAKRFYGKSSLEDLIFKANSKVITDRNKLRPGMKLVIPEL